MFVASCLKAAEAKREIRLLRSQPVLWSSRTTAFLFSFIICVPSASFERTVKVCARPNNDFIASVNKCDQGGVQLGGRNKVRDG